jgi:hypothetical protein
VLLLSNELISSISWNPITNNRLFSRQTKVLSASVRSKMGEPNEKSEKSATGDQEAEIEVEPYSQIADMGLDIFSDVPPVPMAGPKELKVDKAGIMAAEIPTKTLGGSIRDLAKKRLKSLKIQKQYQAEVAANSKIKDNSKKKSKKPPKADKEEPAVPHRPTSIQTPAPKALKLYDDEMDATSECPNTPELPSDNALEQKLEEKLNELKKLDTERLQKQNRKRRASDEKKAPIVSSPKRERKRKSESSPGPGAELEPGELKSPKSERKLNSSVEVKKPKESEPPATKRRRTISVHSEKSKKSLKSRKSEKSSKKKRSERKKSKKQSASKKIKSKDKKRDKNKDSEKDRKRKRESKRRESSSDRRSKSSRSKSERMRSPLDRKKPAEVPTQFLK